MQSSFDHSSPEFTLEKIMSLGLNQLTEQISKISGAASKELLIEQVHYLLFFFVYCGHGNNWEESEMMQMNSLSHSICVRRNWDCIQRAVSSVKPKNRSRLMSINHLKHKSLKIFYLNAPLQFIKMLLP